MLFGSRLPLSSLIELCRVMRNYLGAGLTLVDVFRQQAAKGPAPVRPVAGRIALVLEHGGGLEEALKRESAAFPPLLLALAGVGEQTGMLPEVFAELEKYYLRQRQLRRQFLSSIAWPVVQFFLAILVLAGLIFVLGLLPQNQGRAPAYDPLGLGLLGAPGALIFLGVVFGGLLGLAGLYLLVTRALRQGAAVDTALLAVPVVGPCLRALALSRFCLALRLTSETGMSVNRALRLALRATGNGAFASGTDAAETAVRAGDDLTVALKKTGLFPGEFLHILAVGEESGRLTDVLHHQAENYHEEAGRRLAVLTAVAGYGVWAAIGAVIIFAIFRLFLSYLDLLNAV